MDRIMEMLTRPLPEDPDVYIELFHAEPGQYILESDEAGACQEFLRRHGAEAGHKPDVPPTR